MQGDAIEDENDDAVEHGMKDKNLRMLGIQKCQRLADLLCRG